MSDGTVRRYKVNPFSQPCIDGDWMLYSDHRKVVDELRTQARELAAMLNEYLEGAVVCRSYVENVWQCIHCDAMNEPSGDFEHADDCEVVKTKALLQTAQAVLKDGR